MSRVPPGVSIPSAHSARSPAAIPSNSVTPPGPFQIRAGSADRRRRNAPSPQQPGAADPSKETAVTTYPREALKAGALTLEKLLGSDGLAMTHADIVAAVLDASLGLSQAELDVIGERRHQIGVEGFTPEHDDFHCKGEMARAAGCYALYAGRPLGKIVSPKLVEVIKRFWPWNVNWWKPTDRRRDLVKAGSLIQAEIERLDRAAAGQVAP